MFLELTESECKLEFLKFLQQQETFGSTFFVVNQKTVSYYPETLLIAINRQGFHIIDTVKKVFFFINSKFNSNHLIITQYFSLAKLEIIRFFGHELLELRKYFFSNNFWEHDGWNQASMRNHTRI